MVHAEPSDQESIGYSTDMDGPRDTQLKEVAEGAWQVESAGEESASGGASRMSCANRLRSMPSRAITVIIVIRLAYLFIPYY